MDETMKANDLYLRAYEEEDFLEKHELFVQGAWQKFDYASTYRHPGAPLLLEVDHPPRMVNVPMDADIPVRLA